MTKLFPIFAAAAVLHLPSTSGATAIYKFNLAPNDAIVETCQGAQGPERSKLAVALLGTSRVYAAVSIKVKACTVRYGFRQVTLDVNVPAILLDAHSLNAMPSGTVVSGIPSTKVRGRSNQIRLTKGSAQGDQIPVTLEWLNGEYLPVRVSVSTSTSADLPWKRLRILYKHPMLGSPLNFSGSLSRIDRE